jgi:uncharacterized pyridoxamine 5'-phosphate oxidase family protein
MVDFISALKGNPNGVLATQDGKKVRTRMFQYLFNDGNKVYFCTSSQKPVFEQLQKNPNVSFCTRTQDFSSVLSVNGKAIFAEDINIKARILDENPAIKGIYNTPDNPAFKIFYIDVKEVETFNFSDGAKRYSVDS